MREVASKKKSSKKYQPPLQLGEGGGEVGVAHEIPVELKRYEIATLPSVARNDNLAAGGPAALGDGPDDEGLAGRASRSQRLHAPKRILHQIDPGGL
jgi:hypothetical protein